MFVQTRPWSSWRKSSRPEERHFASSRPLLLHSATSTSTSGARAVRLQVSASSHRCRASQGSEARNPFSTLHPGVSLGIIPPSRNRRDSKRYLEVVIVRQSDRPKGRPKRVKDTIGSESGNHSERLDSIRPCLDLGAPADVQRPRFLSSRLIRRRFA